MKHKAIIFTLSCLILGLCSCKSTPGPKEIDINNRPKGYYLNYWLKDEVDITTLDQSLIYEIRYGGTVVFLDSNYEFIIEQEEKKLPENYVLYYTNLEQTKVRGIEIKDPSISLYGLSMNSDKEDIDKTLTNMGFSYYQGVIGSFPTYIKDNFEISIDKYNMILFVNL